MPHDRFYEKFGQYIDLKLSRAMEELIASLGERRLAPVHEVEEEIEDGCDDDTSRMNHSTPRQLSPPPSPPEQPAEDPRQQQTRQPGQPNGYVPPPPRRGRPPRNNPQLPGGPAGHGQEGY